METENTVLDAPEPQKIRLNELLTAEEMKRSAIPSIILEKQVKHLTIDEMRVVSEHLLKPSGLYAELSFVEVIDMLACRALNGYNGKYIF